MTLRDYLIEAAIQWKLVDQPDKPLAVVRRWATWYVDLLMKAAAEVAA